MREHSGLFLRLHSIKAQENGGTLEPVKSGTKSQQDQPPQEPTDSVLPTTPIGDNRQPDMLNTDSTLYAKRTIAYSQVNDAMTLDAEASSTATEAGSLFIKSVPSPKVVEPILYVDLTSTFSTTLGSAWGTLSDSTTNNDAGYDGSRDMPPATASHTAMMYDDQSYGADRPPSPPPNFTPPPHPLLDNPPPQPVDRSCSSSSPTSASTPQAATASNSASRAVKPYPPPASPWIHCVVITIIAFVAVVICVYRKWHDTHYSPPVPAESAVDPLSATFPGPGRTCGSMVWCFMKQLRNMIDHGSARPVASLEGLERAQRPIDDSKPVPESKTSC
jgi:hypothetical protein